MTIDRQIAIELNSHQGGLDFFYNRRSHHVSTIQKVHEFFRNQAEFDTVKLSHDGKKSYLHFHLDEIEVYDTKQTLRKTLSQESGGAWVEEIEGQKRYFVEKKGWFKTSYQEVSKKQCLERVATFSTNQKASGIGLGILALMPGLSQILQSVPIHRKDAAFSLIAFNQNPFTIGMLSLGLFSTRVSAQAVGDEFQINTITPWSQENPRVAGLNDGGFVVVWQSDRQDGDGYGVYGQRFDANAAAIGNEFRVNNITLDDQKDPSVAAFQDGGWIITWTRYGEYQDIITIYFSEIYGQIYDENGTITAAEFLISTNSGTNSNVALLETGGFVVVWQSKAHQDGDSVGISARRYLENGTPAGNPFQVNTFTADEQEAPSVSGLINDGFVVTWHGWGSGDSNGIHGQIYNSNGVRVGSQFVVNTNIGPIQTHSSLASLNNEGFVVTWQGDIQDGDSYGIFGQRYLLNGSAIDGEFQINNYTVDSQVSPSVASLVDGGFIVAWVSWYQDGFLGGIYAQRFNVNRSLVSSEFQVNSHTTNSQSDPNVAALPDGGFVIVWESNFQDGSNNGVFGKRYDANGIPISRPISTSESSISQFSELPSPTHPISSSTARVNSSSGFSVATGNSMASVTVPATTTFQEITQSTSGNLNSTEVSSSSRSQVASTTMLSTYTEPTGNLPPSLQEIEYSAPYPITSNGQQIGTFSITGGEGQFSTSNSNTLMIELSVDYQILDGQVITLFSDVPDDLVWDDIVFLNGDGECFDAEGQFVENERGGNDYTLIFEVTSGGCEIVEGSQLAPMAAMLAMQ